MKRDILFAKLIGFLMIIWGLFAIAFGLFFWKIYMIRWIMYWGLFVGISRIIIAYPLFCFMRNSIISYYFEENIQKTPS